MMQMSLRRTAGLLFTVTKAGRTYDRTAVVYDMRRNYDTIYSQNVSQAAIVS